MSPSEGLDELIALLTDIRSQMAGEDTSADSSGSANAARRRADWGQDRSAELNAILTRMAKLSLSDLKVFRMVLEMTASGDRIGGVHVVSKDSGNYISVTVDPDSNTAKTMKEAVIAMSEAASQPRH